MLKHDSSASLKSIKSNGKDGWEIMRKRERERKKDNNKKNFTSPKQLLRRFFFAMNLILMCDVAQNKHSLSLSFV